MGTANSAPAMTLSPTPKIVSHWRRETFFTTGAADSTLSDFFPVFGSGIRVLLVGRLWVRSRGGIRLAGRGGALRGEPGDHIGHLWRGQRQVGHTMAPVGMAEIGPPGDDARAQVLIADESKIRTINNRTALRRTFAVRPVAGGAEGGENFITALLIARRTGGIRRWCHALQRIRFGPTRSHPAYENVDLLVIQHAARAFGKRRHQRAGNAKCRRMAQRVVADDG